MTPEAERFNGWAAMLGFVAAVGAYVTTGQIIPGWFQVLIAEVTCKSTKLLDNTRKYKLWFSHNFYGSTINFVFLASFSPVLFKLLKLIY